MNADNFFNEVALRDNGIGNASPYQRDGSGFESQRQLDCACCRSLLRNVNQIILCYQYLYITIVKMIRADPLMNGDWSPSPNNIVDLEAAQFFLKNNTGNLIKSIGPFLI